MVMKKNAMRKNLSQSILKSFGRYLAIILIIALGSSLFVGLVMTKFDMVETGQQYMDEQNMFDLRLVSPYGWDLEHVEEIARMEDVEAAEGVRYLDALANLGDMQENEVFRFYNLPENLNKVLLRGGRMPENPNECLADGFIYGEDILGMQVSITDVNEEDTLDCFTEKTFTVVGYVASPLYMDMNRGSTAIGSGSLSSFFYIPEEAFDMDYYVEINVTIPGSFDVYTDAYNDAMEVAADRLEPHVTQLVFDRYHDIYNEAMAEYEDGVKEYEDGVKEYEEEKADALQELEDAYNDLLEAEDEIAENEQLLDRAQVLIYSGRKDIENGKKELEKNWEAYEQGRAEYNAGAAEANKTIQTLENDKKTLNGYIAGIDTQLADIDAKLRELEESAKVDTSELDQQIAALDDQIAAKNAAIQAATDELNSLQSKPDVTPEEIAQVQGKIDSLNLEKAQYEAQKQALVSKRNEILEAAAAAISAAKQELLAGREQILAQRAYLASQLDAIDAGLTQINTELAAGKKQLDTIEAQLKQAERDLKEGRQQLVDAQLELNKNRQKLEDAKVELADGWVEYEDGKAEAEEEFAKAEKELEDAKLELEDAWDTIQDMDEPTVYLLDRSSNVGYGSLDSASDIVAGVSRIIPGFFLLVASLVCITTMTRMIDEERTQIGTLKALGYTNREIINKYLVYAGSGAVIGCGLGVIVGSKVFPSILWEAYQIMLYLTDKVVLQFNWALCFAVVAAYTVVMMGVTWYCCRRTLQEEPAELIRPKAPEAGKKIFMEYLPFWNRISFLNKVTIRNIVRYRQRLAMMLVGIGGCTALLLTGFGLRDSIVNVVDFQFANVTVYDMTVHFDDAQTEAQQKRFEKLTSECVENVMFFNQISAELEHEDRVKEIFLMTADQEIAEFVNFKQGETTLPMPGLNEVLLTVGVTENMGIELGDTIIMRNADMEELELTVSGIYDNHVNNYAVITPETVQAQWDRAPEEQMALIQVHDGQDVYSASTVITDLSGVLNVSISQELADMVGSMMDALDLVVWVIVFCAALLAIIVLYNLTNININERIREIATIKVLGFNASETAAYVFKENIALTVIGAIFGLGLGYLLLAFVMTQIKIDMVWFKTMIISKSYLWSVLLTILSALVVNFLFYFKLEKINMAEALKSVE